MFASSAIKGDAETTSQHQVAEVRRALHAGASVLNDTADRLASQVVEVAKILSTAIAGGHKILVCGNGGSAADSQHFAAELVGRYRCERAPLPALALTVDTSVLTSLGNDYGFDRVFARQVTALGSAGDVLLAISTSGNSQNVLAAVEAAHDIGIKTVGLLGMNESRISLEADVCLQAPATDTSLIQQAHIAILHVLCDFIEQQCGALAQPRID